MTIGQKEFPSDSQRALQEVLAGPEGRAIRQRLDGRVHRTVLWKYASAKRRPEAEGMLAIELATDGRVSQLGWVLDSEKDDFARFAEEIKEAPTGIGGV